MEKRVNRKRNQKQSDRSKSQKAHTFPAVAPHRQPFPAEATNRSRTQPESLDYLAAPERYYPTGRPSAKEDHGEGLEPEREELCRLLASVANRVAFDRERPRSFRIIK